MRGDKLVIRQWHRQAAQKVAELLGPHLIAEKKKATISVAGESGAGKSEIASVLADALKDHGLSCAILQQDDYFVYPPKTNESMRRKDMGHVGLSEVRLDLLDQHLLEFLNGGSEIRKPLVIFEEDRIIEETLSVDLPQVLIAEGTYVTGLENVTKRVFIDRTYEDTRESRAARSREKQDDFLEQVLRIEHEIISKHKKLAHIIITRDHDVRLADDND
jgi:uridine kinase